MDGADAIDGRHTIDGEEVFEADGAARPEAWAASWSTKFAFLRTLASTPELSGAALRVGIALTDRANAVTNLCCPSRMTLARDTGLSPRSVRRAVAELEAAGLVRVTTSPDGKTSNRYFISWNRGTERSQVTNPSPVTGTSERVTDPSATGDYPVPQRVTISSPKKVNGKHKGSDEIKRVAHEATPAPEPNIEDILRRALEHVVDTGLMKNKQIAAAIGVRASQLSSWRHHRVGLQGAALDRLASLPEIQRAARMN